MTSETIAAVLDLDSLLLAKGAHRDRTNGLCLMEAVAWQAGEHHSDRPACVSPILGNFGRELNDRLPDDRRQLLKPLIPQLLNTANDGLDEARGYLALDWLIRTYTPAWLDLAGLGEAAQTLRDLRRIADLVAARSAGPVVRDAGHKVAAAWAAARAALRSTVETLQLSAIDLFSRMIRPEPSAAGS